MQIGIGSYAFRWALGTPSFHPPAPVGLEAMVREAATLGCAVLQVADNAELDAADDKRLERLRELADDEGVRWQIGLTGATPARLQHYLGAAERLGADVVRLVVEDAAPGSAEVGAIRDAAASFEAAGVRLGIENHFTMTSPDLVALVRGVDNPAVGVVLDVANSILCGEWPTQTIDLLAPLAVCVHLKDYRLVPDVDGVGGHIEGAPLGSGLTDVEHVVSAVQDVDDGTLAVVLEQWAPRLDSVDATIENERAWRRSSVAAAARLLPIAAGAVR
ncbi:sugar phosphate isomerase/epimerase [Occultella aeris]|uniref:Xylose isomerase-like TIM barrel n=1 Tax=Occultella aeris TaxID=2761496 RepID=A0A7M4DPK9_9MICO|nr:sugar phosphate isomerase/epimerase family protein [Occultella aeris]VZO39403.1 Xylose isomerase-like TIM barrel [Occultella aeris]